MAPREQVAAYLSYLGYADRPEPTLDSLARVGRVGRAGYCFHQNGALETVLTDLGFRISRRAGHVWTTPDDRHSGVLNHLVLVADDLPTDDNPGGQWWVDVGLGDAMVDPLPLVAGPCGQSGFAYEITEVRDDGWSFLADPLGSFRGVEVGPAPSAADIEDRHAALSTPPSPFTKVLVVQRRDTEGVDMVRGCLAHRVTAASQSQTELTSYDAWREALTDRCGLSLDEVDDEDLRDLWDRTLVTHRAWTEAGRP